jgi:hypothetical protein
MPLPGAPHTFALESCRDMLGKLEWEIAGIEAEQEMPDLAYRAFNCALTAWHLSDWVWKALSAEQRQNLGPSEEDFRRRCREECPALARCWLITNASKHGGVDLHRRKIGTDVWAEVRPLRFGDEFGQPFADHKWRITVTGIPREEHDAIELFHAALNYWTPIIYGLQLE